MINNLRIANHVGNRIRQIREYQRISLLSLAYISEIEYSHLSKIEFGKVNTSLCNLLKISKALNVCIICLFTNENLDVIEIMQSEQINQKIFSEVHQMGNCTKMPNEKKERNKSQQNSN